MHIRKKRTIIVLLTEDVL